jgi:hypothetical protein
MWPDTSEYPPAPSLALDATGLFLPNGQPAYLFSASAGATPVVTDLHFKWMQQYGIDVANVSRFLVGIVANSATSTFISQVLANVQSSATKYSRQFAIVYDITNAYSPPSGGNPSCYSKTIRSAVVPNFFNCVTSDWMNLVNAGVTQSPAYFKVNGLPYVSIFGLGFADQNGNTYDDSSARGSAHRLAHSLR